MAAERWNELIESLSDEELLWLAKKTNEGDSLARRIIDLDEYMILNELENPSVALTLQLENLIERIKNRVKKESEDGEEKHQSS